VIIEEKYRSYVEGTFYENIFVDRKENIKKKSFEFEILFLQ